MNKQDSRLGWAIAVCLACATSLFGQKPAIAPPPPTTKPATATVPAKVADYSQEAAVIQRIRVNFRYENDGGGQEVQYVRVHVQAQAGVDAWGQLVVNYNASTDKIHVDFVRVRKPDGHVVTAGPDAVRDLSSPVARIAPVYTDIRQLHITVPDLGIGDTLEYQLSTQTIHPLVPGQFFFEWDFSKKTITLNETLAVNVPRGRELKLQTSNGVAAPQIQDLGDRRIYTWHSSFTHRPDDTGDQSAKKKKGKPPKFPDVAFSTFGNWAQVGRWYQEIAKPRAAVTDPVRAEAATLVRGQTTDLDKVKTIYKYVSENIRYVSLSFGLGQYQPHPAAEVLANQYGDCKDKATLFQALLAAEGIKSYPVLINAVKKVNPDVPSPGQFDHLINVVEMDGKTYWADTTPGLAPFGFLLASLRDKWALVMPPSKAPSLERTPEDPPFMPIRLVRIDGKIDSLGRLQGDLSMSLNGDLAVLFRSAFDAVPQSGWPRLGRVLVHSMLDKQTTATDSHVSDPDKLDQPIVIDVHFSDPDVVNLTRQETSIALPSGGVDLDDVDRPDKGSTDPLKLGTIHDETISWKIDLPPQLTASLPVPVHLTRDYAQYDATYSLSGRTLTAQRHLILRKAKLSPSRYDDFEAFRAAVQADEQQVISLANSAPGLGAIPKDMSADDLFQAAMAAERAGNYTDAARLLAAVAQNDPDRENIWTQIGYAQLEARKYSDAVTAFKKQIARNPFDPYAYDYLGTAYDELGRNDDAILEYKKQIEVNPLHRWAHAHLANDYLLEKKYALAEPELESAIKLDPKNYGLEVNLGDAQLGAGKDAAALRSFQKAMAQSPTPPIWNDIAYVLSEHRTHLHMAEQLSENSIRAVEAQLNGISLDTVGKVQVARVGTISAYWDTMGWILFQQGRTKAAEAYIHAAWMLENASAIGDHMGQIYQKEGRREAAIRTYAFALLCPAPLAQTRTRLAGLVGLKNVESEIKTYRPLMNARLNVQLPNPRHLKGSGQFWVLLFPGSKASRSKASAAKVEDVKFISGDASLRDHAGILRKARLPNSFPPGEQTKVALRGTLSCANVDNGCVFAAFTVDKTYRLTLSSASSATQ